MASISKFGQYVLFQVHNEKGVLVFETDSLRVDFDVRIIQGWSRATFTLFNLNPDTIRKLGGVDNDLFVTVYTSLHDAELSLVAYRMYISNALEELKLPNSEFKMFCFSSLRKNYLEKQIDIKIDKPNLQDLITQSIRAAEFTGKVEFKHFPPELLSYVPPQKHSRQQGSLHSILEANGNMFGFNAYTDGGKMVMMYKPDAKNVAATDFYAGKADVVLATSNMRSNPKIGPATLSVVSNLDTRIRPASVLDTTELLTIGTNTDELTLQVAQDYLRLKVSGFTKYQAYAIQHKGSNWTPMWQTQVAATSPTPGTKMPTVNWWQ